MSEQQEMSVPLSLEDLGECLLDLSIGGADKIIIFNIITSWKKPLYLDSLSFNQIIWNQEFDGSCESYFWDVFEKINKEKKEDGWELKESLFSHSIIRK